MKKIGILTFSYGTNYGGTLQCLALNKILLNLEYEAEVVNYYPKDSYSLIKRYLSGMEIKKNKKIKKENLYKVLLKLKYVDSSIQKFDLFRKKNVNITEPIDNFKKEIEKNYSVIIVGSDQVWSVRDFNYFLQEIRNISKISYAACSGSDFYREEDKERLASAINDFNHISVRNNHTHNFVKRLTGQDSEIVCDPSILYDYKEYLTAEKPKEKYILTYILGSEIDGGHRKVLEEIKKKVGDVKIIAVGIVYAGSGSLQFYPWADEVLYDASPEDWLNLINNAEFIYTDSYHGVLFSMKFHKKFLSYYAEKGRASRFIDLADRYAVGDWIVNSVDEMHKKNSLGKEVDYKKVDNLLNIHREYSMNFLKKALGEKDE